MEVKNLYFAYNGNIVLKNINLEINLGESVAILGENGAGKTTLIKHFNGLLRPKQGSVKVLGMDTRQCSVAELSRHVGIVFQNPDHQLFAETVEKEVAFALENFGFSRELIRKRTNWALKLMGLTMMRHRSPFTLSDGEKRRLAIACILAYDPEIIVFDEPTAGQDGLQKEKLGELIKLLLTQNKTIIVVTHDIEFVSERFKRVVVMSRGRIIADGHPREILTDEKLLISANLLPPQATQCAWELRGFNIPKNILYYYELKTRIVKILLGMMR
ncbi:MAG: ABC transporter ATP-binding protein [Thermoprotei archaeon]|nr:MAG: ABC transporter ATP-binding protein [Thermoprotei archaeon]HDD63859.1 ABC transporter ATP-binding protein [Thermoprotei archaeon]